MDVPAVFYLIIAVADAAPLQPRVFIAWIDVEYGSICIDRTLL